MKKLLLSLFLLLIASSSFASMKVDSVRYLSSKAGQNWFISANGSINAYQGSERIITSTGDSFDYTGLNGPDFGFGVAFGKWITHSLGIRVAYDINKGSSFIRNKSLLYFLVDDDAVADENGYYPSNFWFHNLHADVLFSPVDFFKGYYSENRIYTPVIFAGMGGATVSEGLSQIASDHRNFELSFDAGLINNFKLNKYLDINLELRYSFERWCIDSWSNEFMNAPESENYKRPKRFDNQYAASLGLTYYIGGRIYELPYNYENELRSLEERIKQLEDTLANQPEVHIADTVIKTVVINNVKYASYPFSIFFHIDSYELMSKRDLVNLSEIARIAKDKDLKIKLTGSADAATATPSYNQTLSENRCRKIAMELMNMGVPEENIIKEPKGGVTILDPTQYDRRVIVELLQEE